MAREGDNLTLNCSALGHPRPHIVWRREDGDHIMVDGKKGALQKRFLKFNIEFSFIY